jgi:hypothetical protein
MRSSPKVSILCVEGEYMVIRIYNSDTITHVDNRTIRTVDFLEWISGLSVPCAEIAIEQLQPALEREMILFLQIKFRLLLNT